MLFPYSIGYSIAIDSFEPDQSPKWLGTGRNIEGGQGFLGERPAFKLSEGWITLSSTTPDTSLSKNNPCELDVGHALSQILKTGDELQVRRNHNGCWTYQLVRDDILAIGVGYLSGKYGSNVDIQWQNVDLAFQKWVSGGRIPPPPNMQKGNSHAIVCLTDETFELGEKEEVIAGPYYVRCLDLGDPPEYMGGWPPRIAVLRTQELKVRESLVAYLSFQDELVRAYMEISDELFASFSDPQKVERKKLPPEEFEADRRKKLREREERIAKMYVAFGMRPPRPRWT